MSKSVRHELLGYDPKTSYLRKGPLLKYARSHKMKGNNFASRSESMFPFDNYNFNRKINETFSQQQIPSFIALTSDEIYADPDGKLEEVGQALGKILSNYDTERNVVWNFGDFQFHTPDDVRVPNLYSLKKTVQPKIIDRSPVEDMLCLRDYSKKCPIG